MKPSSVHKTTATCSIPKNGITKQPAVIPTLNNVSYDINQSYTTTKYDSRKQTMPTDVENEPDYIAMESVGRYEDNKYIVDGDEYEIPCVTHHIL